MPGLVLFLQPVSNGLLEDPSEMATSSTPLLSEVFFFSHGFQGAY